MALALSIDSTTLIVADTSTVINLNATGCAEQIIRALRKRFVVVDVVTGELDSGRKRGRNDADRLQALVESGIIEIVALDEQSTAHFEELVVGPALSTLEDGEAATIAYAVSKQAIAVIDERKATRLCMDRYPNLGVCSTVDLLAFPEVHRVLGEEGLAEAVFLALSQARMRVFPQHVNWIVSLIGNDKAAACTSLPAHVRRSDSSRVS